MHQVKNKIDVLLKIAKVMNENGITWAVGASLLLYFKDIINNFNDIDIIIAEKDVEKVKNIFSTLGTIQPKSPNENYKTKVFMEYDIDGIEVDIIAGFIIVNKSKEYYFPLRKEDINEYKIIDGLAIPLQSLEQWFNFYKLMNRYDKVKMIKEYIRSEKKAPPS